MGLPQNFIWVLADLCQKLVLDHACYRAERNQKESNHSYLPTKIECHTQSDQQGASHINKTRDSLRDQIFGTLGTSIDSMDKMVLAMFVNISHLHIDCSFECSSSEHNYQVLADLDETELLEDNHEQVENRNCEEIDWNCVALGHDLFFCLFCVGQGYLGCHGYELCDYYGETWENCS